MTQHYTTVIQPAEEGGYWSYIAEVRGAFGLGATEEEALKSVTEALDLLLECMREDAANEAQMAGGRLQALEILG